MIRALFFDLDNTLFDRGETFRRYALDLLQRRGLSGALQSSVFQRMVEMDRKNQHLPFGEYVTAMTGHCPELQWDSAAFLSDYLPGLLLHVQLHSPTIDLLHELSKSHELALVTNGGALRQREKLKRSGLLACFEPRRIFISEEIGSEKPHPPIFNAALATTSVSPAEILFCGDDPVCDIAGAHRQGLKTCWVRGVNGRIEFPEGSPRPDVTIQRVDELPALLASGSV